MRILVNGDEMKRLDQYSIRTVGIPSLVLMERAAKSVFDEVKKRKTGRIRALIVCGSGNNGADGLAMARMFSLAKDTAQILIVGNLDHATDEFRTQLAVCRRLDIPVLEEMPDRKWFEEHSFDVIVDAMLGTGLSRLVGGRTEEMIEWINHQKDAFVVSVDIPSGISAATGAVLGTAVRADLTVTFEYEKLGLALFPGAEYAGECVVSSIGIVPQGLAEVKPMAYTMDPGDLTRLPNRPAWSNKGTFGRVLVIAGSRNMAGASVLAGEAAYRAGAGLVQIYAPECNREILQTSIPEAVLTTYEEDEFSLDTMEEICLRADSIVVGPGLGLSAAAEKMLDYVLQCCHVPTVVDADALNLIARHPELTDSFRDNLILTPHLAEMGRLSGVPVANIRTDPLRSAREYSREHGIILVQKDARTVVARPDGKVYVNTCGNAGMAVGGSGDVLSGIIGGLLAGGMEPYEAATAGVLMHAHAGDLAEAEKGQRAMLARDIIRGLGAGKE